MMAFLLKEDFLHTRRNELTDDGVPFCDGSDHLINISTPLRRDPESLKKTGQRTPSVRPAIAVYLITLYVK